MEAKQLLLFEEQIDARRIKPFRKQLLKWIGNKQRFAHEIISYFPDTFGTYYEPFLGSGAILGSLAPPQAVASDALKPLIEIWQTLRNSPETLKMWYAERWNMFNQASHRKEAYEAIKAAYNANPNGADLLFLSRSCYGGVVRFRKADGYMSTPCGIHNPIKPESFSMRVDLWSTRTKNTTFYCADFEQIMAQAKEGDLIYCDPPYFDTQSILYGAQAFTLERLFKSITEAKKHGVYVALSIDGTKKTGKKNLYLNVSDELFESEAMINCGRSMLRRFQMAGKSLEDEVVSDRLLLTW